MNRGILSEYLLYRPVSPITTAIEMARLFDHVPEIFVALSYYQCGVYMAFILNAFNSIDLSWNERDFFVWSPAIALFGAFLAAATLSISKAIAKRIVWLHYYLLAAGSALLLGTGLTLIINQPDYNLANILGGLGYGLVYISGMAYIHVRTRVHKHRIARIGLCHLAMAIGMVSSVQFMSAIRFRWDPNLYGTKMNYSYFEFGYFLNYSSASILAVFLLNELLHGVGVYNYKMCLDPQLRSADQKKDRLKSALLAGQDNPRRGVKNTGRQVELMIYGIVSKGLRGFFFNNLFLGLAVTAQFYLVSFEYYVLFYFILGGVLIAMIFSLSTQTKILYPVALVGQIICLAVTGLCREIPNTGAEAVFFWLFYLFGSAASIYPDVMIMEVAAPSFYEASLFVGFFLEQIPIVTSIAYVHFPNWFFNHYLQSFWFQAGAFIGLGLIMALLVIFRYPNTFRLSLLDIQHLILYGAVRPIPATTIQSYPPNVVQPPLNNTQMHAVYPTPGYAPGLTHQQMPIVPVPQPGSSQGYFSTQPAYPGQQPLYPQQPMFMAPVQQQQQYNVSNMDTNGNEKSEQNPTAPPAYHTVSS